MKKPLVGNILFISAIIIICSGIMMFIYPYNKHIAAIHTTFGLVISLFIIIHINNNRKIILKYITGKLYNPITKYTSFAIIIGMLLWVGIIYLGFPYSDALYKVGNNIRNSMTGIKDVSNEYQIIYTKTDDKEYEIDFEFKKGDSYTNPLFAAWLEDSIGNYIETLYISASISASTFKNGYLKDKKWLPAILRRPEALPCWSHSRNIKAEDGLYVPLYPALDLDAVTGATPQNNFIIKTGSSLANVDNFRILFELNQSFDWNEYYAKNSFPTDSIYSGSGAVGQPSLVYSININKNDILKEHYFIMKPLGHGHHSGKNGYIDTNFDKISTALSIADRIIIAIHKKQK